MSAGKPITTPAPSTLARAGARGSAGAELRSANSPLRPLESEGGGFAHSPLARQATWGGTARAVFWSFFGVRKRAHYESDSARLNPVHLIIMGIVGAAVFIAVLLSIIKFVVLPWAA